LHTPFFKVKKKSPKIRRVQRRERSELELLSSYRKTLTKLGTEMPSHDLDNDFFWLFRLDGFLAQARRKFDEVNQKYFSDALLKPRIIFCNRATGGYYNKTRHTIGISLAMTIEHGEPEFFETLLHEIAHIAEQSHNARFYEILRKIGGTGRKAPATILLRAKRERFLAEHYRVQVRCPNCKKEGRYRTRRALRYACRDCCTKFAGGKFDERFRFEAILQ
jgi:predicted metal-dependent hydrolase